MAKTCAPHGHFKKLNRKKMSKEYFLIKSDVYPVLKCYEQECQLIISKPQISVVAYNLSTMRYDIKLLGIIICNKYR